MARHTWAGRVRRKSEARCVLLCRAGSDLTEGGVYRQHRRERAQPEVNRLLRCSCAAIYRPRQKLQPASRCPDRDVCIRRGDKRHGICASGSPGRRPVAVSPDGDVGLSGRWRCSHRHRADRRGGGCDPVRTVSPVIMVSSTPALLRRCDATDPNTLSRPLAKPEPDDEAAAPGAAAPVNRPVCDQIARLSKGSTVAQLKPSCRNAATHWRSARHRDPLSGRRQDQIMRPCLPTGAPGLPSSNDRALQTMKRPTGHTVSSILPTDAFMPALRYPDDTGSRSRPSPDRCPTPRPSSGRPLSGYHRGRRT